MKYIYPEIMSPAGNMTCLIAALNADCDAVYLGTKNFNMRAAADNFSVEELYDAVKLCHSKNVKVYVTLNTLIYENEILKIEELISEIAKTGIDAIICSDFFVMNLANKYHIPIIASTQLSISSSASAIALANYFKIKRIVLARECSIDDLQKIKRKFLENKNEHIKNLEVEIFAHGAMCVSVSGRCLLSAICYGKSANRGECIQPCRRHYKAFDPQDGNELELHNNYIISPKDLCIIPFIEKLIDVGVDSFKIEGRNRSPEYVYTVTSVYKQLIKFYVDNGNNQQFESLKEECINRVKSVYNREFSSGFYLGKPINEWTTNYGSSSTEYKVFVGYVTNYYSKSSVAEILIQDNEFNLNDTLFFIGNATGLHKQQITSMEIENKQIETAKRGTKVAIKTDVKIRRNDKIYLLKTRTIQE